MATRPQTDTSFSILQENRVSSEKELVLEVRVQKRTVINSIFFDSGDLVGNGMQKIVPHTLKLSRVGDGLFLKINFQFEKMD